MSKTVLLIAFYNKKALGVRYLETALRNAGYTVKIIFYKDFNSVRPKPTTKQELELLQKEVQKNKPLLIGLSVMSSMYLDTVHSVIDAIQACSDTPVCCGGAFATMFPEHFLNRNVPFVLRSDGEISMCQLADALYHGTDYSAIPSLCFKTKGKIQINDIGNVQKNIDTYGVPTVNSREACFIEHNTLTRGDPQLSAKSYEVIASRGCPFTCSYCCCVNLRRLLPKGIPPVRTRSVQSVIEELKIAKKECKSLAFVHFYDEIFPNLPGWVEEFTAVYPKEIGLPFTIWSHPKMVDKTVLKKLKKVGLVEVIMGIQSGSERIRKDVFHRYETQEDILNAVSAIREAGVFWSSFDFMLQHPFENLEDLKESYFLAKRFPHPYELQLHGLNFLPGTDIVDMALKEGFFTKQEMHDILFAPMNEQFSAYWKQESPLENQLWYKMLYCLQFPLFRRQLEKWEENPVQYKLKIEHLYTFCQKLFKIRYIYKKGRIVFKRYVHI